MREKDQADWLLHNIIPKHVTEKLRTSESSKSGYCWNLDIIEIRERRGERESRLGVKRAPDPAPLLGGIRSAIAPSVNSGHFDWNNQNPLGSLDKSEKMQS